VTIGFKTRDWTTGDAEVPPSGLGLNVACFVKPVESLFPLHAANAIAIAANAAA
jgi:hypothetical protein